MFKYKFFPSNVIKAIFKWLRKDKYGRWAIGLLCCQSFLSWIFTSATDICSTISPYSSSSCSGDIKTRLLFNDRIMAMASERDSRLAFVSTPCSSEVIRSLFTRGNASSGIPNRSTCLSMESRLCRLFFQPLLSVLVVITLIPTRLYISPE